MLSAKRIMILLDFGTGLRRGELSGVKWEDSDFRRFLTLAPSCSSTVAMKKPILDEDLIAELLAWRKETPYAADSDFVFASAKKNGKQPYWMSKIMQLYIKPVAAKLVVPLKGWHTLRHSHDVVAAERK
jgi:integrase